LWREKLPMNKKRKILTIIALAVFCVIIALHYIELYQHSYSYDVWVEEKYTIKEILEGKSKPPHFEQRFQPGVWLPPLIQDIHMPLFALAVLYAGLFLILGPKKD
jgi:hypothetical protein